MIANRSIWSALNDAANNNVWDLVGTGAPTNGTSGTGANLAGPGSTYTDYTNKIKYMNTNTIASPTWSVMGALSDISGDATVSSTGVLTVSAGAITSSKIDPSVIQTAVIPLTAAQIIAMYTTPVSLIAAPGAGKAILVDGLTFEFTGTATQFTGGGAVQIQYHGYAANLLDSTIAAATIQANATAILQFGIASTVGGNIVEANTGIDITNATAAFAAGTGTAKVFIRYRIITL